jgi:hypothetical protein
MTRHGWAFLSLIPTLLSKLPFQLDPVFFAHYQSQEYMREVHGNKPPHVGFRCLLGLRLGAVPDGDRQPSSKPHVSPRGSI